MASLHLASLNREGPLNVLVMADSMFLWQFSEFIQACCVVVLLQDLKQVQLKQRPSAFRPWSPKPAEKVKPAAKNEVER